MNELKTHDEYTHYYKPTTNHLMIRITQLKSGKSSEPNFIFAFQLLIFPGMYSNPIQGIFSRLVPEGSWTNDHELITGTTTLEV